MRDALTQLLDDHETGFAIGVMGAIGEFIRDAEEPATASPLGRITARGGIALRLDHATARLIAWEEPSSDPRLWRQAAALLLPEAEAAMGGAALVTEVGPDAEALRAEDRAAILFDMGVGFAHLRAGVRTADSGLIATLRAGCGMALLDPANPAAMAIIHQSPHRVFLSKLARIEVYQPIPPPDGRSPEGPHTHLLPKLLATGRAHAATSPIPEGWVSVLDIFPAHPLRTPMLEPRAFDAARHAAFQALLERFGLPGMLAAKQEARASGAEAGTDRHSRGAARVALRQMAAEAGA
ncbi:hypothetical protein [Sediminicoccus sp. KRV36]|uniref:DUF6925 family protein n=1 Tax=Sediminicoccus sp. KRV36 TaxID=3133721 RepID=UPI00200F5FC4|nr:hypothetical protein [Sediminicoccus rosea]UPY35256.1 hypothetical protein LHU95_13555 [Sediminicoccus rosea]